MYLICLRVVANPTYSGPANESTDCPAITTIFSSPDDKAKASASDGLCEPLGDDVCANQYKVEVSGSSYYLAKEASFFFFPTKIICQYEYGDTALTPLKYQTVMKQVSDLYTTPY